MPRCFRSINLSTSSSYSHVKACLAEYLRIARPDFSGPLDFRQNAPSKRKESLCYVVYKGLTRRSDSLSPGCRLGQHWLGLQKVSRNVHNTTHQTLRRELGMFT